MQSVEASRQLIGRAQAVLPVLNNVLSIQLADYIPSLGTTRSRATLLSVTGGSTELCNLYQLAQWRTQDGANDGKRETLASSDLGVALAARMSSAPSFATSPLFHSSLTAHYQPVASSLCGPLITLGEPQSEKEGDSASYAWRADSVRRKRKRKMNKHKHAKRRKLTRHKR